MSRRLVQIPQLDALRALAAASVIAYHFIPDFGFGRLPYGWIGVDTFFVISGFLITTILVEQKAAIGDRWLVLRYFIVRRSLRLFPAYFLFIAFFAVLMTTAGLWSWDGGQGIWYWTYTSNFLQFLHGPRAGHLTHLWSLAVEEQFYLVWPWFVLFLSRRWLVRSLPWIVVAGALFAAFAGLERVRMLPFSHLHTLGMGALLAIHRTTGPGWPTLLARHAILLCTIGACLLIGCEYIDRIATIEVLGVLLIAVPLVAGCIHGFSGPIGLILTRPWLPHLGRISYGLYLYHKPVPLLLKLAATRYTFEVDPMVLLACSLIITWLIAEVSFRLIERPFLRLKARFDT